MTASSCSRGPSAEASLPSLGIALEFTDTDASGFGGVNRYMTFTSSREGARDIAEIASTMMAGPDDAMAAEQDYIAALGTVTGCTVAGDERDPDPHVCQELAVGAEN